MKPYGLVADLHMHGWSAFSSVTANGLNGRLGMLIAELDRAAKEVLTQGGETLVLAGDIFHVRGSLAPTVLNPVRDAVIDIINSGLRVVILAGNHDAELKDVTRLSSAITALEGDGCLIINETSRIDDLVLVPWHNTVEELKETLKDCEADGATDLIIHAPIDGVIPGLPDHGLSAEYLGKLGFRRVFAGHYHDHRDLGNGVYSIGALAHHSWSDVRTKAGFIIVSDDKIQWFKSHAPEFVEIDATTDPADIPMMVDGNYVRAKINSTKQKDVEDLRAYLIDNGAAGVVILAQKDAAVSPRTGATVSAGASLEVSVADFIKKQSYANPERLSVLCQDILTTARSAA